jgi:hypothetical protein
MKDPRPSDLRPRQSLLAAAQGIDYKGPPVERPSSLALVIARLAALLLAPVLVASASAEPEQCLASCPDDGEDGACAPECADCDCCAHAAPPPMAAASALSTASPASRTAAPGERCGAAFASPAGDVFHVPRSSLA